MDDKKLIEGVEDIMPCCNSSVFGITISNLPYFLFS